MISLSMVVVGLCSHGAPSVPFSFRKIAISLVYVFLASSSVEGKYRQGLAALLVFMVAFVIQQIYRPYRDDDINFTESLGLLVSATTFYAGLWTFADNSGKETQDGENVKLGVTIFIIAINLIWCADVAAKIFKGLVRLSLRAKNFGT